MDLSYERFQWFYVSHFAVHFCIVDSDGMEFASLPHRDTSNPREKKKKSKIQSISVE